MAALNHLFDLADQICYVQCTFCSTILLVSVPTSSLSMVVTVRCGHCTSLLSVNMMKMSFMPFHLLTSFAHVDKKGEGNAEEGTTRKGLDTNCSSSDIEEEEDSSLVNRVINKPPEKRQRAPSAYNRFIKEEIRRLKSENPSMAHKEAFSTAAKNWAHFPPIDYQEEGESFEDVGDWSYDTALEVNTDCNGCIHERKSKRAKTPYS